MTRLLNRMFIVLLLSPYAAVADEIKADIHPDTLTGLEFATIPAGAFMMGNSDLTQAVAEMPEPDESLIRDEIPVHKVTFNQPFQLSTTEVTQQLWLDIMNKKPGPDSHWQHAEWQKLPVVSVSWNVVQQFIDRLNQRSKQYHYRLPSEAEWEYAARAGNRNLRPFNILEMDEYAWYLHSSNDEIHPVATLNANPLGLYDMLGNTWEWVQDWYSPDTYRLSTAIDPKGPKTGTKKVRRGGSYHCPPHLIRPGYRAADTPDTAYSVIGFRLVREKR